jgi:pimeloyl-ACP methyl ester carboxylesterase
MRNWLRAARRRLCSRRFESVNTEADTRAAAWKTKPTFSIVGANDQTVHPDLERFVAKRMNAKITELQSSHVPMLSQPQRVYEVIREAAEAVSETKDQLKVPAAALT